jgi:hypothetical protein
LEALLAFGYLVSQLGSAILFQAKTFRRLVPWIDMASLRLCSSNVFSEAAYSSVRDLFVNRSTSESQHNGRECRVLKEVINPDFQ